MTYFYALGEDETLVPGGNDVVVSVPPTKEPDAKAVYTGADETEKQFSLPTLQIQTMFPDEPEEDYPSGPASEWGNRRLYDLQPLHRRTRKEAALAAVKAAQKPFVPMPDAGTTVINALIAATPPVAEVSPPTVTDVPKVVDNAIDTAKTFAQSVADQASAAAASPSTWFEQNKTVALIGGAALLYWLLK